MKPEAQRIAIAEWCGWQRGTPRYNYSQIVNARFEGVEHLPNFCGDLNLMHDVEKRLPNPEQSQYRLILTEVCTHYRLADWQGYAISATAAQRAEAFLKTLGLWKEETP